MTFSEPRSSPHLIVGYTTRQHLLLDLDNTTYEKVRRLAYKIMRQWPNVGDCLIVQSSNNTLTMGTRYSWNNWPWIERKSPSYHLVFDNIIGYNNCCRICETLAELGVLNQDYVKIRTFRGDMTLRVSHQNMSDGSVKPAPEPRTRIYNLRCKRRDGMIEVYLGFLRGVSRLFPVADVVPEVRADGSADEGPRQHTE